MKPSSGLEEALGSARKTRWRILGPYLLYCLMHLVLSPWLVFQGLRRSRKRGYSSLLVSRLFPMKAPRGGRNRGLFISTHLGETRTAARALLEFEEAGWREVSLAVGFSEGMALASRMGVGPVLAAPFNNPISVALFLWRVRPKWVCYLEWPDWPHLAALVRLAGIPSLVLNVYMTQHGAQRQRRRVAGDWRLDLVSVYAAQGDAPAQRLRDLGVASERALVTGPVLASPWVPDDERERSRAKWREELGVGEAPLVVAGSSYPEEDPILLEAFARARANRGDLRLVLAPRKLDDAEKAVELASNLGFSVARRTSRVPAEVLVLNTHGELASLYAAADLATVGGTWSPWVGGHTPTEALACGVPLTCGPRFAQQESLFQALLEADLLSIREEPEALAKTWIEQLSPKFSENYRLRAREFFESRAGVFRKLGEELARALGT